MEYIKTKLICNRKWGFKFKLNYIYDKEVKETDLIDLEDLYKNLNEVGYDKFNFKNRNLLTLLRKMSNYCGISEFEHILINEDIIKVFPPLKE